MPGLNRKTEPAAAPLRAVRLGPPDAVVERAADGTIHIRASQPLGDYHNTLSEPLERWAHEAPERVFLAQRDADDQWRKLTYAEVLDKVQRIGASLLRRGLSAERPIAILSGNDIEHALLALAAMHVGIPYAPVSAAYSLLSGDFGRLRMIMKLLTPGLVFASDGLPFGRAIYAAVPDDAELVVTRNPLGNRKTTLFSELLEAEDAAGVAAARARVTPDSIAKFLFTSGSTGTPKAVINTQRMLCANQAMLAAGFCFVADEPPVVVDWLPWSHTFGSNHNFNMVLVNGGSLYIDDGNPTPPGVPKTARNLREIAPTIYFNVPKGYEALIPHFRADETLRKTFFSPAEGAVLCRRRPEPDHLGRPHPIGDRDHRRAHHLLVVARLDRDLAAGARLQLGLRSRRQYRPAVAGRRTQAGTERRQAGGAAARAAHHTRLLAAGCT